MSRTTDQSPTHSSIRLPPEIWEIIFDYVPPRKLPKLRLVCRHWRDMVTNCPKLLEKITFSFFNKKFDAEQFSSIAQYLRFRSVKFAEVPTSWPSMLQNWTHLEIGLWEVSLSTLLEILRYTVNLKQLDVCNIMISGNEEANFRLEKLEHLHLGSVNEERVLIPLGQCFPNLKKVYIHLSIEEFDEEYVIRFLRSVQNTLEDLVLQSWTNFLAKLSTIDELKLKRFFYIMKDEPEEELVQFCRAQPYLKHLQTRLNTPVPPNRGLTNSALCEIGRNLPNLKSLKLRNISLSSWTEVFTAIEPLKFLQFLELFDLRLESQSLDCPIGPMENLHTLNLLEFKMAEPVMAALFRALLSKPEGELRLLMLCFPLNSLNVSEKALECARNNESQEWGKMTIGTQTFDDEEENYEDVYTADSDNSDESTHLSDLFV